MSKAARKFRRQNAKRQPSFQLGPSDIMPIFVALSTYPLFAPAVKEQQLYKELVTAFNPNNDKYVLNLRKDHAALLREALMWHYGASQVAFDDGDLRQAAGAENSRRLLVQLVLQWERGTMAAASRVLTQAVAQAREFKRRVSAAAAQPVGDGALDKGGAKVKL